MTILRLSNELRSASDTPPTYMSCDGTEDCQWLQTAD